jgi:hypothetical protein
LACRLTLERSIERGWAVSRHHDGTMMRDENRAKNHNNDLILLKNLRA